tara:strand:- start:271 stop:1017 length:747 start_codon:yes stop_codon:yes gene_type:complete
MTTENETTIVNTTRLSKAQDIRDNLMKEGVHYGKVVDNQSDFLYLSGASLLADVFEIDGIMSDVREEQVDGQSQITVVMDMVDRESGNRHCVGVGTWDSGEMLGNMKGARQRGIAMAYKRAYVMGVRYATSSHGMFSQDKDVVDSRDIVQGTSVPRQQTSEPTQAVDTDTGEKLTVPPEMRFDENRKELVFTKFGAKAVDKSIDEIMADNKGFLEWMLNLGSNPSKPDETPISMDLRTLIVKTLKGEL